MKKILRFFVFAVFAFALTGVANAQSQATTGLIQGTVYDSAGAVVPGASITVRNTETGFTRTVSSNSDGFFTAPLLPLGNYNLKASAQGFADYSVDNLKVTIGQTQSLRLELSAAGANVTVDVTAATGPPRAVRPLTA